MKKVLITAMLAVWMFLSSCSMTGNNSGNNDGTTSQNPQGSQVSLKLAVKAESLSRSISSELYAVTKMDIIIKDESGTNELATAQWVKDGGVDEFEFILETPGNYKLHLVHYYIDGEGVENSTPEGPYAFSLVPGYITVLSVTPGAVVIEVNGEEQDPLQPLSISAFIPDEESALQQGDAVWIDILINDVDGLADLGNWTLKSGYYKYTNLQMSASDIENWSLSNGQTIRCHADEYTGETDTVITDNNSDLWDYKTTNNYEISEKYGIIWLESEAGDIIDLVAYNTAKNTSDYWLSADPLTTIETAVTNELWPDATLAGAFDLEDITVTSGAGLKEGIIDGNSKDDWTALTNFSGDLISEIQGAAHTSPKLGDSVNNVQGIITQVLAKGFYLQSITPDDDPATSEGIYVYMGTTHSYSIGDHVAVSGTVYEYFPGGTDSGNLSITQISSPSVEVISSGNDLPEATIIGIAGRTPPGKVICDDSLAEFDPENDGLDFYESLEGMLVQVNQALVVGPTKLYTSSKDYEIAIVPDNGDNVSVKTIRDGMLLQSDDYNPEIIILNGDYTDESDMPLANNGAVFTEITGIIGYSYEYYKLYAIDPLTSSTTALIKEVTTLESDSTHLTIGCYNVQNLSAVSDSEQINGIAQDIFNNLNSPDIVGLVEIMDNNGPEVDDGTVDAAATYQAIIDAIVAAGGPVYEFRDIAPRNNSDGGWGGGNIRCGFIFNPANVSFIDRAGGTATAATTVSDLGSGEAEISFSPGRIDPTNAAFDDSRKPVVGEFHFDGEKIYVIVNHFNSKGGDDSLYGSQQPPVLASETQRNLQAQVVNGFVQDILDIESDANIVVLGDLNDFQFSQPLTTLKGSVLTNLVETLPLNEQYTYIYKGNSQVLDHILVSNHITTHLCPSLDIVHINSEYHVNNRFSDHDPLVLRINCK
ncbi:MAG: hypothetical protein MJB14_08050 [Spirochaetes bacterium]|nr:hypothetical protein [Spirochaetota bacterium]